MQRLVSPGWSEMPTRTIKGGIAPVPEQDRKELWVLNGSPRGFIEMVGLARSCVSYTRCHNQEEKCHSTTVNGIIIEPSCLKPPPRPPFSMFEGFAGTPCTDTASNSTLKIWGRGVAGFVELAVNQELYDILSRNME